MRIAGFGELAVSAMGVKKGKHAARVLALVASLIAIPSQAAAHPHVFVEANLEVVRDDAGLITEVRHVWRFDEVFSSTVVLDFDENGDGVLDKGELDIVASETKQSLAEYNFFTEIRNAGDGVDVYEPEPYIVDYVDGQILMIIAMELVTPTAAGNEFKISVSDPTYYVAVDLVGENAVHMSGNSTDCEHEIERPDFDALLARDQQTLIGRFTQGEETFVATDEYLTWVHFRCA
jgi:ABC-type uncharacterized transport system substrate-binding protein